MHFLKQYLMNTHTNTQLVLISGVRQLSRQHELSHRKFGNFANSEPNKHRAHTYRVVEHETAKTVYAVGEI